MDDFLGTSIQYSEQQILLLEKEYAAKQEKVVEDLIKSGFLDSDYEDTSTENEEYSEYSEYSDNESTESTDSEEIKENLSPNCISPKSISLSSMLESTLSSTTPTTSDENVSTPTNDDNEYIVLPEPINMALVLAPDISVVDGNLHNLSNSVTINDADADSNDQEPEEEEEEELFDLTEFDLIEFKSITRLMEIIWSDVKYLMLLCLLMVALPHIAQRGEQSGYGGIQCGTHSHDQSAHHQHPEFIRHTTQIRWFWENVSSQKEILNEEDDERDEYQDDDDDNKNHKQDVLHFDIMTTTLNTQTNKMYSAKLIHHEFKITPSDLLCNDDINNENDNNNNNNMQQGIPRLFLQLGFGAGLKSSPPMITPQMMRIFKETLGETVGRQFTRTHGLTALVMSFVGIAAFAVGTNTGIDEYITISS